MADKKPRKATTKAPSAAKSLPRAKVADTHSKTNWIADLRNRLHLNQTTFAQLIPVSVRSLATLESGKPPTEVVSRRLVELRRLINALSEVIRNEALGIWLQTPNDAFDGLKPLEVIHRGESDRLWTMIYVLRSGTPS